MTAFFPLSALLLLTQWTLQDSGTTASLRGIHNAGHGVAWASGTGGMVLHTIDGGHTWLKCAVPPGADKLDFRAVQAFDRRTAIVMSSGTGNLSRVYRTTNACATWTLLLTNPDSRGFWDGFKFRSRSSGVLIGDPVDGAFPLFRTTDGGTTWRRASIAAPTRDQSIFAASNTSMLLIGDAVYFVTGGTPMLIAQGSATPLDLPKGEAAGAFSISSNQDVFVIVGGDYKKPYVGASVVCNPKCRASLAPPHGYRSAVAYDAANKRWIAVGPNGTDASSDNGITWRAVESGTSREWNALSLPFVVGPKGRIGKLSDPHKAAHARAFK